MDEPWVEVENAWEGWTAGLCHALRTLAHGRALFIYPEAHPASAFPLEGPSVRVLRWSAGPPVAIERSPGADGGLEARARRATG